MAFIQFIKLIPGLETVFVDSKKKCMHWTPQNLVMTETQNDSWDCTTYLAVCAESVNSSMMQEINTI